MADTNIQYVSISQLDNAAFSSPEQASNSLVEIEKFNETDSYSSTHTELSTLAIALFNQCGLDNLIKDKWGFVDSLKVNDLKTYMETLSSVVVRRNSYYLDVDKNRFQVDNSNIASEGWVAGQLTSNNKLSFKNNQKGFSSKLNTLENDSTTLSTTYLSAGAPTVEGEEHNRYIFKVSHRKSNIYVTTEAGWFTCYGWLSEKETYTPRGAETQGQGRQDHSKRWVALEAYFENSFDGESPEEDRWRIIQLQPFLPNNFCSYVSFSLPVASGLSMRITTGFDVGSNSGKYSIVPGSLTNHVPNAFVGGVYCYV